MDVYSRENAIIGLFVLLALVGFYAALEITENVSVAIVVALLLGVIIPTAIINDVW